MSESTADRPAGDFVAERHVPTPFEDVTDALAEPAVATVEPVAEPLIDETAGELVDVEVSVVPDPLNAVQETLAALLAESAKYHQRAQQREAVIDTLHAEMEILRRGERQGQLRPIVTAVARAREDVLRQVVQLPEDFTVEAMRALLESFADELEVLLSDNGVIAEAPTVGLPVDPRMHRIAGKAETADPDLVGTIASVRRNGYRDLDTEKQISPAEIVAYVAAAVAVTVTEQPVAVHDASAETVPEPAVAPVAALPAESDERHDHDD
jgi:molecular chaperone GrpE (heat shock protein)